MHLRQWLARMGFRWDRDVLVRRGEWGDTAETLEHMLSFLTPNKLSRVALSTLKITKLRTRTQNVDQLLLLVIKAHWIMQDRGDVPDESIRKLSDFDRTLDDYLTTVHDTPIRPEEVVPRLQEELLTFIERFKLMQSEADDRLEYYRRHYQWLFIELRELLKALALAIDPKLTV